MLNITLYTLFEVTKLEVPMTTKNTILDDPQSQQGVFMHYEKIMFVSIINLQHMLLLGKRKAILVTGREGS
jgi:hypothetical protein